MKRILVTALMAVATVGLAAPLAVEASGVPPVIVPSDSTPDAGQQVVITVQSFPPGAAVVFAATCVSSTTPLGTGTANAAGTATAPTPFTAPSTPGASCTITASAGTVTASLALTVNTPAATQPTTPGGGLPATGTDSGNGLQIALALTLTGAALIGVTMLRRRPRVAVGAS